MLKSQVLIQFESITHLWQFAQSIGAVYIEINTRSKTLLCDCSGQDLEALSRYQGKVVEMNQASSHFVSSDRTFSGQEYTRQSL